MMDAAAPTRVLVVDDEAPIRLLCRVNLEAEDMEVLEAADGISGVETARSERPDVILLDVMMPGMDGWQVAESLIDAVFPLRDATGAFARAATAGTLKVQLQMT